MTDILCMITGIFIGAGITTLARAGSQMPHMLRKKNEEQVHDSEEEKKMSEMIRQYNNILNYTGNEVGEE